MSDIGDGSSRKMEAETSAAVPPVKGRLSDSISYSTTPNEKMSDRWSAVSPCSCSGDM